MCSPLQKTAGVMMFVLSLALSGYSIVPASPNGEAVIIQIREIDRKSVRVVKSISGERTDLCFLFARKSSEEVRRTIWAKQGKQARVMHERATLVVAVIRGVYVAEEGKIKRTGLALEFDTEEEARRAA